MLAIPKPTPATYQDVLDAPEHLVAAVHGEDEVVRLPPFDAIELELSALWPSLPTEE